MLNWTVYLGDSVYEKNWNDIISTINLIDYYIIYLPIEKKDIEFFKPYIHFINELNIKIITLIWDITDEPLYGSHVKFLVPIGALWIFLQGLTEILFYFRKNNIYFDDRNILTYTRYKYFPPSFSSPKYYKKNYIKKTYSFTIGRICGYRIILKYDHLNFDLPEKFNSHKSYLKKCEEDLQEEQPEIYQIKELERLLEICTDSDIINEIKPIIKNYKTDAEIILNNMTEENKPILEELYQHKLSKYYLNSYEFLKNMN